MEKWKSGIEKLNNCNIGCHFTFCLWWKIENQVSKGWTTATPKNLKIEPHVFQSVCFTNSFKNEAFSAPVKENRFEVKIRGRKADLLQHRMSPLCLSWKSENRRSNMYGYVIFPSVCHGKMKISPQIYMDMSLSPLPVMEKWKMSYPGGCNKCIYLVFFPRPVME